MPVYRRIIPLVLAACGVVLQSYARQFNDTFRDSTLRIDYILSGVPGDVSVSLAKMTIEDGWAGRRNNLDSLALEGSGQIAVTSIAGDTLYVNSFSSLFSEWLDIGGDVPQAYENTFLVPLPSDTVDVTLTLRDKCRRPMASLTHRVVPADILIRKPKHDILPHTYLHRGTYHGHRISVAILAEGYTREQMDMFRRDAAIAVESILEHEPFRSLGDRFDFIAVESPSADSGVSVHLAGQWKDTAFSSHFSTFYSDRYLTTPAVFDIHDALHGIPYEHVIILANTDVYGGGGIFNSYTLTTAHHQDFRPVVVHEFGHSFGGLADEYFYEDDVMDDTYCKTVEPWEPNITTLVNFGSKWRDRIPAGTPMPTASADAEKYPIGLYEGGGYSFHGIYRSADICRMRVNDTDHFCPACQAALKSMILYYTE